jgi:glycosyltransferase involved in cell wall biosynthesis
MKILAISNYYPEHSGGIEFVASNLVQRWRITNEVRWMAFDTHSSPHRPAADDVPLTGSNFTEDRLGFPYPLLNVRSVLRIFEQVKWCDVVQVHDCLYMASATAFLASRIYRKPFLIIQHIGMVPYREAYKNLLQGLAYNTLGRLVLGQAERVVFISERVRNFFEIEMGLKKRCLLIPNGVDHRLFFHSTEAERDGIRRRLGYAKDQIILLYAGRFTQKKGLHIIRQIASTRPQYSWLLLGNGEIDPVSWRLANVRVLPFQPQHELRDYYAAADLFVLPSVGEGFPLSAQEALSSGLPVILSKETAAQAGGAPIIEIDPDSLPEILRKLDEVLFSKEKLRNSRLAAIEYSKRWDWNMVALEYEQIFLEIGRK